MSVLFIVVPLAVIVVMVAVGAYVWSARDGQFDDLDTPALRMLHDDGEKTVQGPPPGQERGGDPPRTIL